MTYLVTLATTSGRDAVVTVVATNKSDAKYRAAVKAETLYNCSVTRVVSCLKYAGSH